MSPGAKRWRSSGGHTNRCRGHPSVVNGIHSFPEPYLEPELKSIQVACGMNRRPSCLWCRSRLTSNRPRLLVRRRREEGSTPFIRRLRGTRCGDVWSTRPWYLHANWQYYDPSDPSTFPMPFASASRTAIQTTADSLKSHSPESTSTKNKTRCQGVPLFNRVMGSGTCWRSTKRTCSVMAKGFE
ncbi:hypothetical protein F5148DRAFT_370760 [Russula earlei]|uniref:Uncharacterized protein n=1 Tax=Russula earlei TaxID=71964 RepID=A0ACC0U0Y0_9AGAM|nr:hypothetical protein F5148DRAFT_370760 [Russula earlei]